MNTQEGCLRKGNFYKKTKENGQDNVPLYLGSGDFGGCFDVNGMMNRPFKSRVNQNTVFMHADYWHRGAYGLDYHLPMLQISYEGFLEDNVTDREQTLNIAQGYMDTKVVYLESSINTKAYFNPYLRDVFALEVNYSIKAHEPIPDIVIGNIPTVEVDYQVVLGSELTLISRNIDSCEYVLSAGTAKVQIVIKLIQEAGHVESAVDANGYKLSFRPGEGRFLLLIGVSNLDRKAQLLKDMESIDNIAAYSKKAQCNWKKRWGESFLDFEYPKLQALFQRSIYYMLCSYSPSDNCIAPPTGWTASNWAYHFPQDFAMMTPVLLKMGHVDIVKAKIEFYARQIPTMMAYTKRIHQAKGIMWAWEFPIGDDSNLLSEGYPNWYQFEIHNGAYPTKMAYEAALYIDDLSWIKTVAWPIIYHSAQFYAAIVTKEAGQWGIQRYPSMGQDELGGENSKNYLCALYAAKYTLEKALLMAHNLNLELEEMQQWEEILNDGLAFNRLVHNALGIYQNYEVEEGLYEIGKMKHPVPLIPITFLPQDELNDYEKKAFDLRYQLCDGTSEHFYHGWTLASLMLADARMGDQERFFKDFEEMLTANYVDEDFLQIYESSQLYPCIYYISSHGFLAQAVIEGAIDDNILGFKKLKYHKIHLFHGVVNGGANESS